MENFDSEINKKQAEPLVSVGIMAYNRPEGLRQTLECVTGQTYKNLQIIVSNNCSPNPEVEAVMRAYAAKDSRIVPFSQPVNTGAGPNLLFVLDKSIGEYFMWAADDDYWESNFIEELLGLLQANPRAMLAFCAVREKENLRITDYLDKCPWLSSPDVNKRLLAYLSWPEGANTKGSILYGLHRRANINACLRQVWPYCDAKALGGDIVILYELLVRGPVVFSRQPLYTVTMGNVKYVAPVFKSENFFGAALVLAVRKGLFAIWRREKFYFLVSKTMWDSGASKICFFYSLYIAVIRHLHALWAVIKYPFKKIIK
jgi:glycosyltransferase involved in cell wall biosynthesis